MCSETIKSDLTKEGMEMRRLYGWSRKHERPITCVMVGEMADGTRIWAECDENKTPINTDQKYILQAKSEFVPL